MEEQNIEENMQNTEEDMPEVEIQEEKEADKVRIKFDDQKKAINITFQTIQDITRTEHNRAELQKLSDTFYIDLISYIGEKKKILEMPSSGDLFSSTEKENTRIQLDNMMKLLERLYDKRERKIINMALDKSRVGSMLIDTAPMLEEEAMLFDSLSSVLSTYRKGIINNIKEGKGPEIALPEEKMQPEENIKAAKAQETKLVRFLSAVPKFVGKELEVIGPFEEEDVANLPADIAEVLIKKGRAEAIDEEI